VLIAYVCFSLLVTTPKVIALKVIAQSPLEPRARDEHADGLEPSGSAL